MLNSINISHFFVFDQDKALEFYVGKLGLEVSNDLDLGVMRWLTVRAPGNPSHDILLEVPGAPAMDPKTAEQVRELISKGASGFAAGFTTTDARKTYDELKKKGVAIGETIDIDVELDTTNRDVDVPPELAKALAKDAKAKKYFESLSYSRKYALAAPIANGKTPETRERNLAKAMAELKAKS